ncbi:hypothetical protein LEP1GSC052_3198 [Leptospira kmetyi serovar Malaysia str. Bejo-Iso9]|nr:hypothetical protein LEP1GSC052_3198 [Leptospira kmetyi serovar Malaysia str. Bejo-Iso9]
MDLEKGEGNKKFVGGWKGFVVRALVLGKDVRALLVYL